MQILGRLLANTEYVCLLIAITGIYYIVAGIQYWMPNYMSTVLHINPTLAASYYATTLLIAPISGVLVGGFATSYYGGYNS